MTADELRDKIARAIYGVNPTPYTNGHGDSVSLDYKAGGARAIIARTQANTVLPIVEAEVRKAKAEALREAAHGKIPRALLYNGLREWLILLANEHDEEPTR